LIKLIAFDIDGTLAPYYERIPDSVVLKLKELDEAGIQICFISGKPVSYIAGMVRQLGLRRSIISGENGAVTYFGVDFPIPKEIKFEYPEREFLLLNEYRNIVTEKFSKSIWIQPNDVHFSFFVEDANKRSELQNFTENFFLGSDIMHYLHPDGCFDIVHKRVHKGWALKQILLLLQLKASECITIGDGNNDTPMFLESYYSIGINRDDSFYNVSTIYEAFDLVDGITKGCRICPECGHDKILLWTSVQTKKEIAECDKCEYSSNIRNFYQGGK